MNLRSRWVWWTVAVALAAGLGVVATLVLVDFGPKPVPIPVRWDAEPGAVDVPTTPAELARVGAQETAAGRPGAGMLLDFYGDANAAFGAVVQVARLADGRGVVVLREDFETTSSLQDLTARLVKDATAQGGTVTVHPSTVANQQSIAVEQPSVDEGLVDVEEWFDYRGRRWVLDVLAPRQDVAAIGDRVRLVE